MGARFRAMSRIRWVPEKIRVAENQAKHRIKQMPENQTILMKLKRVVYLIRHNRMKFVLDLRPYQMKWMPQNKLFTTE